jgi:hypothetical protein
VTRLLIVDEVAERLSVTKQWVWAQARAGRIPQERWLDELETRNARERRV